jgi:hypothetical protein
MLSTFQSEPGIGRGQAADIFGQDKSYTRRVMRGLARNGYLIEQVNGNGYAYFPAANAGREHVAIGHDDAIETTFRVISEAPPPAARPAFGGPVIHRLPGPAKRGRSQPLHPAIAAAASWGALPYSSPFDFACESGSGWHEQDRFYQVKNSRSFRRGSARAQIWFLAQAASQSITTMKE